MPAGEHLSDDYVASLLAKDAKTSNSKYSLYGLQELLPRRSTFNAPKPNTRFLKNIIKETDSHNAALRAKEAADSTARFKRLHGSNDTSQISRHNDGRLERVDDHRSKRRRVESDDEEKSYSRHRHRRRTSNSDEARDSRSHRSHHKRHREDRYDTSEDESEKERSHCRHHHRHRRHHERSRSRSRDRTHRSKHDRRKTEQHYRSRSRSPRHKEKGHKHHSPRRRRSKSPIPRARRDRIDEEFPSDRGASPAPFPSKASPGTIRADSASSDSDPLEALVGPLPPSPPPKVRARGRGTFASTSAMDSHFSSNYDPTIDVQPDPDLDDDWDMALEALRDRQRWQKQGAERLKSAGFTEEEVQKWEKGGERTEEDVRWKGRGEGREWDRGKVVGEDGVETKPEWGRLKGT